MCIDHLNVSESLKIGDLDHQGQIGLQNFKLLKIEQF